MSLGRGFFGSLVGAAAGGGAWAALSLATDLRMGIAALAVGALAGFGMSLGTEGRGGGSAGFLAGLAAALGILGSRYAVNHFGVQRLIAAGSMVTPETAVNEVAGDIYADWLAAGYRLEGNGEEYPVAVMDEARRRWGRLTPEQQQQYMTALSAHYASQGQQSAGAFTAIAFLVDLGLFGFAWLGLGVATAVKIGMARGRADGEALSADEVEGPSGAFWARTAARADDGDDAAPRDPLAALGAGLRAEIASDKSGQFTPAAAKPDDDAPANTASGVLGAALREAERHDGREAA